MSQRHDTRRQLPMQTLRSLLTRSVSVAAGLLLFGAPQGRAQQEIWFESSDQPDEVFGHFDIGPDQDGDQVADFLIANDAEDCVNVDDGVVHLVSSRAGELNHWCGTDFWGHQAMCVDDIDAGGSPDIIVTQPGWYDPKVFGFHTGRIQLISAESGSLIREWLGTQSSGNFGELIDVLGDVDGDGYRELLVGAPGYGGSGQGRVWIFSIRTGKQIRTHVGSSPYAVVGSVIRALTDVDGDGVSDYAYTSFPNFTNRVTIRSGATGAQIATVVSTSTHAPGRNIAPFVDVDGDGLDEVLISGGNLTTSGGYLDAYSVAAGSEVWRLEGNPTGDTFGFGMVRVRDMNGDGFAEIMISAPTDGTRGSL